MEPTKKTKSFLELIVLEPESEYLSNSLGIVDERNEVLIEKVKLVIEDVNDKKLTNITDALHSISLEAKHANELAVMVFHFGRMLGRSESAQENPLNGLLEAMKRNFGNPLDPENDDSSNNE
jgi:hypothetical protein